MNQTKGEFMPKLWLAILLAFLIALSAWAIFGVADTQQKIAIFGVVGIILTAVTSVLTIVINNKEARDREIHLLIRQEQQKVFTHFYSAFFEILKTTKKGNKGSQPSQKAMQEMFEFKQGLMNWGSEELIASYLEYEDKLELISEGGPKFMIENGDQFIKSMRKELGFHDVGSVSVMSVILDADARREFVGNR